MIDWVKADYDSPRGPIQSHWRRADGGIEMRVRVPANATAVVHVPAREPADVTEGDPAWADRDLGVRPVAAGDVPGVRVVRAADGAELRRRRGSKDLWRG